MKKPQKIVVIVLAVIVGLVLIKNLVIKTGIEQGAKVVTGLPLKMGKLNVGMLSSLVDIKDLKVSNPKGFEEPLMVDIPEIYVDYKLLPVFGGKIHLTDIRFHLKEFTVIQKADGTTNLDTLKALQETKKEAKEPKEPKEPGKKQDVKIDNLTLKIDTVRFIKYGKDGKPSVKEININLNEDHKDIKSLNAVVSLIVFKVVTKASLGSIVNFDLDSLGGALSGTLSTATDTATKLIGTSAESATKVLGTTKDTLKDTKETLKDTKESLKGLIKNPFGDK